MKSKNLWMTVVGVMGFVLAAAITVYPLVSSRRAEKTQSLVLAEYAETVETIDDGGIEEMLATALEYNAALTPGAADMKDAFSEESLLSASEGYYDLLNIGESNMMGYIEIPKINVYLPIYHGTDSAVLENGVGHLLGSSLPVGGENSHTVLAGHSGLASKKIFSDLDQLKPGDVFYLHILNETLAYEVDRIKTVLPDNTDYLAIERGQDYCTLVTCTPYGVNTHRLLVRGRRVSYEPAAEETAGEQPEPETAPSTWTREYVKGIVIGLAVTVLVVAALGLFTHFRKRGAHEQR